jgi:hypothetical protein
VDDLNIEESIDPRYHENPVRFVQLMKQPFNADPRFF